MKLSIEEAAQSILKGEVVAVPTETVYGLAASIRRRKAIEKIFSLKGRPVDNPLIVHVSTYVQLKRLTKSIPSTFQKIKSFWPGPLTVVLPANKRAVPKIVRAGLDTVAIRMPDHFLLYKLIMKTGPLAAPSANLSGRPSPTKVRHIYQDLGMDFPVLKGGPCLHGVESTVIRLLDDGSWQHLRPGMISKEQLIQALGCEPDQDFAQEKPRSPGSKYRHYAPKAKLIFCEKSGDIKKFSQKPRVDGVLGFDTTRTPLPVISLGGRNHFKDNLKRLYESLRDLDEAGYQKVLVDGVFERQGLGRTLYERLKKACAG